MYKSERGKPLVFQGTPGKIPVLTVENYMKWYDYFLVFPDGHVEGLHANGRHVVADKVAQEYEGPVHGDHIFGPGYIMALSVALGVQVCSESFEMMVGRWEIEYKDNYNFPSIDDLNEEEFEEVTARWAT
jgi:hypothetical protein